MLIDDKVLVIHVFNNCSEEFYYKLLFLIISRTWFLEKYLL